MSNRISQVQLQRDPVTHQIKRNHGSGKIIAYQFDDSGPTPSFPTNPGCCCKCDGCEGKETDTVAVTLAGITVSNGCNPIFGGGAMRVDQAALAGTFTLTKANDQCYWVYCESPGTTMSGAQYPNTTCTGTPLTVFDFFLILQRVQGEYFLTASLGKKGDVDNIDVASFELDIGFFSSNTPGTDCATEIDGIPNIGTTLFPFYGTGGTANIHPNT